MMRALGASLMLALVACGSHDVPVRSAPRVAAPTPERGVRAELPGHGWSAEFPSVPGLVTAGGEHPLTQLSSKGAQDYSLMAISMVGKDRPKDDDWYEAARTNLKLERRGKFQLGSFDGVEIGGTYQGRTTVMRLLAVGDALLVAQVDSKPADFKDEPAQRFFSSLAVTLPWRIYASPITRFSVMVPVHAIEIDRTGELKGDGRASMRAFFVGGRHALSYWATAREIVGRSERVSDEQILDGAVGSLQQDGYQITFQGPVEAAGLRGREFMAKRADEFSRGRMWIGEDYVYMLTVAAKNEQPLREAEVSKFYDSLVWY